MRFTSLLIVLLLGAGMSFAQSGSERAKAAFAELDLNGNGTVPVGEFVQACQALSFQNLDTDGNGQISRGEWVVVENHPEAEAHFRALDANRDAQLTAKEFGGSAASRQRWQAVFRTLDQNGDQRLVPGDFPRGGS